ncbi:MAG: FdhF/YdeP family oxidoreductase [Trueperaceae bacterium]|nr:MAG: FdhF/YdeP family oxidoreductase [Trueperaceae bacterium]
MNRSKRQGILAQPPATLTGLRFGAPKEESAGLPAVVSTARHILEEMGPLRGLSVLSRLNQKGGFDCQGCAWPDPEGDRSVAEFCENGAKAVAEEATMRRLTKDFFERWSVQELSRQSDYWLGKQGRLTEPLILEAGSDHYRPVAWEDAFALIARELNALKSPDEAVFYTSGRTSNEAAFLYQLFVRRYGTNNLPDCSNMCHESSGVALKETIGVGKGTVQLEDFERAEVILIVGQNPGTNHPRMLSALQQAKASGATIISINPLQEAGLTRFKNPQDFLHPVRAVTTLLGEGSPLADLHLPVRINGDVALFKGLMKLLLELEAEVPGTVFDHAFIESYTEGFEALVEDLSKEDWPQIEQQSGLRREELQPVAERIARSERIICCWAMGLTQHENAVANIQQIVNLLLLKGSIGKPGAGVCPVRGHSNVQGDRTMGIWEKPSEAFLDRLGAAFDFDPPRHHGLDTVNAIRAMTEGRIEVFFAMGGNFLSATPDTEYTAAALQNCRLSVQVSTKLNRSHLVTGAVALILPCLGRSERDQQLTGPQFVSVENSMGIVHQSQGHLLPASPQLRSEPSIVAALAEATLADDTIDWDALVADYDRIRELISKVVPGTEDYNRRVRRSEGFTLPNPVRQRIFETPSGKARFTVHPVPQQRLEQGQYLMMTIRSHDQYNTTVYGLHDRYRGIYSERRVVMMHPEDIASAGLQEGAVVDLKSSYDRERSATCFVVVPYQIPRGCVATYFPEANVLVPIDSVAKGSNTPASKSVVVSVHQPA